MLPMPNPATGRVTVNMESSRCAPKPERPTRPRHPPLPGRHGRVLKRHGKHRCPASPSQPRRLGTSTHGSGATGRDRIGTPADLAHANHPGHQCGKRLEGTDNALAVADPLGPAAGRGGTSETHPPRSRRQGDQGTDAPHHHQCAQTDEVRVLLSSSSQFTGLAPRHFRARKTPRRDREKRDGNSACF